MGAGQRVGPGGQVRCAVVSPGDGGDWLAELGR